MITCCTPALTLFNVLKRIDVFVIVLVLTTSLFSTPTFAANLSLGPFAQGVYSGTEPFNTSDQCFEPGDDCSSSDNRVRTGDLIQFSWVVTADQFDADESELHAVVFEQTIRADSDALVRFDGVPTICLPYPAGPGGDDPVSRLLNNADGSQTLLCNLGSMREGELKNFSIPVRPSANSLDSSTFNSSQLIYALGADGNKIVSDVIYTDERTYEISAAPAFDLIADRQELLQAGRVVADLGNGAGDEPGYLVYLSAHIATDSERKGKGVEALSDEVTFKADFTATAKDGLTTIDVPYKVLSCAPNANPWPNAVYGNEQLASRDPIDRKVVDSGHCTFTGSDELGYEFSLQDIDSQGQRYPSQTIGGQSLATGPYFVAAYQIGVFVPFSAIESSDGDDSGNGGAVNIATCLSDFDPDSRDGVSNYASDVEPGYNGNAMPDGSESNNCTGPLTLQLSTEGGYNHRLVSLASDSGDHSIAPLFETEHVGTGSVEAGTVYAHMETFFNTGSNPLDNFQACFKFDSTVSALVDADAIGATSGQYAFIADDKTAGFDRTHWQVQYGQADFSADSPLDKNADNLADFNAQTGRYEGSWDAMRNARCTDTLVERWVDDPTIIGVDSVNVVRFTQQGSTSTIQPGQTFRAFLPLQMRDAFVGGRHDGQDIPVGTVAAALSSFRTDQFYPRWRPTEYSPSPESSQGDGDRVTFTQLQLDALVSTHEPFADSGVTRTVFAGNSVVWDISTSVSSKLADGGLAKAIRVVGELPVGLSYDAACTQALSEGLSPALVEYDVPASNQQTLNWDLGQHEAGAKLPAIRFCTTTDPFAEENLQRTVRAYAWAENATVSTPTEQSIILSQTGELRAAALIDTREDATNDIQVHTMKWVNFSRTTAIDNPTVISVLPHMGDGQSESSRFPESKFSGTSRLVGEPTARFSGESVLLSGELPMGDFLYTADKASSVSDNPSENTSYWCRFDGEGFTPLLNSQDTCPLVWGDVTAIQFISNHKLERVLSPRRGQQFSYRLKATNNKPEDTYTAIFGFSTNDFAGGQVLRSVPASITIASHSIGDFIFVDVNADGRYTSNTDVVAPDGLVVELRRAHNDSVVATTTTAGGTFLFNSIGAGEYYVQIPASQFGATSALRDWDVAPGAQAANQNANHDTDHSGFTDSTASVDGIRTDIIQLSANVERPVGVEPVGQEPIGDNVFGLTAIDSYDDYSNLTVDIGLLSGDADNDGVADIFEYGSNDLSNLVDSDMDGIPNYLDADSDNDGIKDGVEAMLSASSTTVSLVPPTSATTNNAAADSALNNETADNNTAINNNLALNATSATSNENTIADLFVHGMLDSDDDGTPNYLDADSDNDGLPDALEHLATASIGASSADRQNFTPDVDQDGVPNYIDTDSDNDGVLDRTESQLGASGTGADNSALATSQISDTDGDGIPDQFDVDQTNGSDTNNDGIDDQQGLLDTDNDGLPDFIDSDSDNDRLPDTIEYGREDSDADGIIDQFVDQNRDGAHDRIPADTVNIGDTDSDGIADHLDKDVDGDGVPDAIELFLQAGASNDGDDLPAYLDIDSDNDGILDGIEIGISGLDDDADGIDNRFDIDNDSRGATDTNGDGISDFWLSRRLFDTDGDGNADAYDTDSDADGLSDAFENRTGDSNNDAVPDNFIDSNGDGLSDDQIPLNTITPDTDGDGVIDALDMDSDNDGLPDAIERLGLSARLFNNPEALQYMVSDFDADGIPDFLDTDADNDGILDRLESQALLMDADGDGISNVFDADVTGGLDSNFDGIDDRLSSATLLDSDNDGFPDHLDLDADNDTIFDIVEAGATDRDDDGIIDGFIDDDANGVHDSLSEQGLRVFDTDLDGLVDSIDEDSDNDGLSDALEFAAISSLAFDLDEDGLPDFRDADSDNDGINDGDEASRVSLSTSLVTQLSLRDTDNDGIYDQHDLDSDNDGISDQIERGTGELPVDTNRNGIPDFVDFDSDGDGIPDKLEGLGDRDADGLADRLDTDADNDGIADLFETGYVNLDSDQDGIIDFFDVDSNGTAEQPGIDSNLDGIDDRIAALGLSDSDGDNVPDFRDLDSDNDGISDAIEMGSSLNGVDSNNDGVPDYLSTDSDGDGINDEIEYFGVTSVNSVEGVDTDGDGLADYIDQDSDNDGIADILESQNWKRFVTANVSTSDSIAGAGTVSQLVVNNQLLDFDGDGIANHLDLDSDNDGVIDAIERAIDSDDDGLPDFVDMDSNNDGLPDSVQRTADENGDGISDRVESTSLAIDLISAPIPGTLRPTDTDSDGDGIADSLENSTGSESTSVSSPVDPDRDGKVNSADLDSDNDGIPDSVEGLTPDGLLANTDNDALPDYLDLDSDNDGIDDAIEGSIDFDNDSIPDFRDTDSDNDGIPDEVEQQIDSDSDGLVNRHDLDSDNDQIPDRLELGDVDEDGLLGFIDTDSDNDGISDTVEATIRGTRSTADEPNSANQTTATSATPMSTFNSFIIDVLSTPSEQSSDSGNEFEPFDLIDTDSDGIPDIVDRDSDNDTEDDASEGLLDADADGLPDYIDTDSNANGVNDRLEHSLDSDGDGIADIIDADNDNDGIPDGIDGFTDNDGDALPNYIDTDSDGDGIADAIEAGTPVSITIDTDNDGIEDRLDLDSDNDGVLDADETAIDTDGDGEADYKDRDSDNDGSSDATESGFIDADNDGQLDNFVDENADGVSDTANTSASSGFDLDGDQIPDRLSSTSVTNTIAEPSVNPSFQDTDGDGLSDELEGADDFDGDGVANYLDLDSDNDGLLDEQEAGFTLFTARDTDADSHPDFIDHDSDNDGLSDAAELLSYHDDTNADGLIDNFIDQNNNGVDDAIDAVPVSADDSDFDGIPNHLDLDSDGDGLFDLREVGGQDNDNDGVVDGMRDRDGDFIPDTIDIDHTAGTDNNRNGIVDTAEIQFRPDKSDQDGDGIIDSADIDINGDGFANVGVADGAPNAIWPDSNGDGIPDVLQKLGATPFSANALDEEGIIHTGVDGQGSGCAINFQRTNRIDPFLLMMMLTAAFVLIRRRLGAQR